MAKTQEQASAPAPSESGLCPQGYARDEKGNCYPVAASTPRLEERPPTFMERAGQVGGEIIESTPLPDWMKHRDPKDYNFVEHLLTAGTALPSTREPIPSRAAVAAVAPSTSGATGGRAVTRADLGAGQAAADAQKAAEAQRKAAQVGTRTPPEKKEGANPPPLKEDSENDRALRDLGRKISPGAFGPEPLPGFVKLPDGRIVTTAQTEKSGLSVSLPAGWDPKAEAARFMAGRTGQRESPLPQPGEPGYRAAGSWSFSGGLGTGQARSGTYTPSTAESVVDRNRWLDQRKRQDQADELSDLGVELQKAKADYAMRMMSLDPTTMARIAAEARMGPERIKQESIQSARIAALVEYRRAMDRVLADPKLDDAQRRQAMTSIARDAANILLGERVSDPQALAQLFAMGFGTGMGASAGATAAGEQK